MSQEILEISVLVEEKFDMSFNLANGQKFLLHLPDADPCDNL